MQHDDTRSFGGFNTQLQQVDERFSWINDMIRMRQDLVRRFMQLISLPPPKEEPEEAQISAVISFCDHLIDYVSHGHFDLFPKLLTLIEHASGRSLSIANRAPKTPPIF